METAHLVTTAPSIQYTVGPVSRQRRIRLVLTLTLTHWHWCFTFYKKVKISIKEIPKLLVGAILCMYPARCRHSSCHRALWAGAVLTTLSRTGHQHQQTGQLLHPSFMHLEARAVVIHKNSTTHCHKIIINHKKQLKKASDNRAKNTNIISSLIPWTHAIETTEQHNLRPPKLQLRVLLCCLTVI